MEQNNSEKMVEVAALPKFRLPLNLQLFAEGDPIPDVVAAPKDEIYTSAAEHAEASVKEPVVAEQVAENEVVAETVIEEPVRDLEKDAAFAEMRRKTQEAETKAQQFEQEKQKTIEIARKFGHLGIFSDAEAAEKYGRSHGLFTLADVERQMQIDEQRRIDEEYRKRGIDPEEIKGFVKTELDNHPDILAAREAKAISDKINYDNLLVSNYNELLTEFKDLVTKPEDISPEVWTKWNEGNSGLTLSDAYALVNRKTLAEKQQAATKQAALNQLNSKAHMKTNEGSSEELETGSIPDEVMTINRRMFAKELKAGTMTEKTIIQHYLRHNKK